MTADQSKLTVARAANPDCGFGSGQEASQGRAACRHAGRPQGGSILAGDEVDSVGVGEKVLGLGVVVEPCEEGIEPFGAPFL